MALLCSLLAQLSCLLLLQLQSSMLNEQSTHHSATPMEERLTPHLVLPLHAHVLGCQHPRSLVTPIQLALALPLSYILPRTTAFLPTDTLQVSVVPITTTTLVSTTSTVLTTNTAYLTTTVTTTTTLPTPSVCGAPSSSNLVSNPSFECGTLSPWIKTTTNGVYAAMIEYGLSSAGSSSLFTYTQLIKDEGFAPGQVSQILTTIPGKTYSVSFDMHMDGFGCYWTVSAAGVVIATNEINGVFTQTGWQSYSGTFAASATTTELVIQFRSGTWGYADWTWDNFVVAPVQLPL